MGLTDAQDVARVDSKQAAAIASNVEDYDALVHDAAEATQAQEQMSLAKAIKTYPNAIMFSLILSLAVIMEGYDTLLIGNFFAMPAFARKYGVCNAEGKCEIPAPWQSGLTNGSQVGSIIGLQLTGIASERYGYRRTILVALAFMTAFIFIPFFAPNLTVLLIGQILQGLPWGCFQTLTTAYAAEVTPVALRPFLTTWVNGCWVVGQLIASGILRGTVNRTDHWAYKIPYAIQWVWPVPIFIGCWFAPESPWWLVRQNRLEDAKHSLRRLAANDREFTDHEADQTVQMMIHTNELEKAAAEGGSYWDCLKKTDRRRTEIACVVWLIQVFCGGPLMGLSSYFYTKAGLPTDQAFNLSIGQFAMGLVGTLSSWFLLRKIGRRALYLYGQIALMVLMIVAGGLAFKSDDKAVSWAIGSTLLIFTFIYDLTVGPGKFHPFDLKGCHLLRIISPNTSSLSLSSALASIVQSATVSLPRSPRPVSVPKPSCSPVTLTTLAVSSPTSSPPACSTPPSGPGARRRDSSGLVPASSASSGPSSASPRPRTDPTVPSTSSSSRRFRLASSPRPRSTCSPPTLRLLLAAPTQSTRRAPPRRPTVLLPTPASLTSTRLNGVTNKNHDHLGQASHTPDLHSRS